MEEGSRGDPTGYAKGKKARGEHRREKKTGNLIRRVWKRGRIHSKGEKLTGHRDGVRKNKLKLEGTNRGAAPSRKRRQKAPVVGREREEVTLSNKKKGSKKLTTPKKTPSLEWGGFGWPNCRKKKR